MRTQDRLDEAFRALMRSDPRVVAALTYGSRPMGLGDAFSDVEYWVFVEDEALASWSAAEWIDRVERPALVVPNEFGAHVAIYAGLVRVELHFWPASDLQVVCDWPARGMPVADMLVVDRSGRLREALERVPERPTLPPAAEVGGRFVNWWVLGWNVLRRGELERAYDALGHVRRHLLWLARLSAGATERWLTPSRLAEQDLPEEMVADLAGVAPRLTADELTAAYRRAWLLARRWWPGGPAAFGAAPWE